MDIATLGFAVDTSALEQAGAALDQVAAKATTTATATAQVGTAATQAGATAAQGLNQIAAAAAVVGTAAASAGSAAATGLGVIAPAANAAGDAVNNLSNRQMFTLQRSLTELGYVAAGGASPFTMMAMAAEHAGIIMGEGGGLEGIIASVTARFGFLAQPATAAFAAIGAVVVAGISGLIEYEQQQKAIAIGLNGIGAASGVTAVQVRAIGESVALSGDISRSTAIQMAADFLKVADNAGQVATAESDAAKMVGNLGVKAQDAQKALEGIFTDPIKGYQELTKQVGGFNIATDQEIASLQSAGAHSQAVAVALDAVGAHLGGMTDQTNLTARAWNAFVPYIQDFSVVALTSAVPGLSALEQGLAALQQHLAPVQTSFDGFTDSEKKAQQEAMSWGASLNPAVKSLSDLQAGANQAGQVLINLQAHFAQTGSATKGEVEAMSQLGNVIDIADGKISALINEEGNLITAATRIASTTQAEIATINSHTDALRIAAAGEQAYIQARLQGLPISAQIQASLSAEDKATATLANSWQDASNKMLLGLDLQQVKLQSQIDLIGKNTAAQQQGAMAVQQYDTFANLMFSHGITSLTTIYGLWNDLNTDVHGVSDTTQSYNQFQTDMFNAGITDVNVIMKLWQQWTQDINASTNSVSALINQLNSATAAAKALAAARVSGGGTPVNSADEGQPNTSWTPSSFTPSGFAEGGSFEVSAPPSNKGVKVSPITGFAQGFAEGGQFVIPGPPSRTDNVMVKFPAAPGERVTITPAHKVAQQGFASGGHFDVQSFADSHGTVITSTPPAHAPGGTGHESTAFHEPKVPKPKAPPKPHVAAKPKAAPKPHKETKAEANLQAWKSVAYMGGGYEGGGFADGGEFVLPDHPAPHGKMMVQFPAATGERIEITPAHGKRGFANGGDIIVPGAGLSSHGGGPGPGGPYAGINAFGMVGGGGISSPGSGGPGPGGIYSFGPSARAGVGNEIMHVSGALPSSDVIGGSNAGFRPPVATIAPATAGGGSDGTLSDISDALQLASVMSPSNPGVAASATTQSTSTNTATGGGNNFYISVSITANDPTSFSNSSAQIASVLRRAISSATSHMGP